MYKIIIVFCFLFKCATFAFSDESKSTNSDLLKLVKNLPKTVARGKFGFEINCDSKEVGRNLVVLGYMDIDKPEKSWFVILDPYVLNMPIEGFINEEYFILNPLNGLISKSKNLSFKLEFHSEDESEEIEDCININSNEKSNEFNVTFPKLPENIELSADAEDPKCIIIRGEEYNYSYSFIDNKLKSYFIYSAVNAESRFSLFIYYDLKDIFEVQKLILKYLKFSTENKFIIDEKIKNKSDIRYTLIGLLSLRTKFFERKTLEYWVSENLPIKLENIIENYSKLRNQFLGFIFSENQVQSWFNLIQFSQKWENRQKTQ